MTIATPNWFSDAIAHRPTRSTMRVDGADIELLTWGERGQPGLLFLHGMGAHADWWSFIAPFFASAWRVAAISWSGMGGSDWRESYTDAGHAREILAAMDMAGMSDAGTAKPIVVAHSFGGLPATCAAAAWPERLRGLILVDSVLRSHARPVRHTGAEVTARIYPSFDAILERFRFVPPQIGEYPYIRDFIGRHSIRSFVDSDGIERWTWRFDPQRRAKSTPTDMDDVLRRIVTPTVLISGAASTVVTDDIRREATEKIAGLRQIVIPEAGHHVMADRPLELISTLRAVLATWNV